MKTARSGRLVAFVSRLLLLSLVVTLLPISALQPDDAAAQRQPPPADGIYACVSVYTDVLRYIGDSTQCQNHEQLINLNSDTPITLCASIYTGILRYPGPNGSCTSNDHTVILPGEQATALCLSTYTNQLRYLPGLTCPQGSTPITIPQDNETPMAQDDAFTTDEDTQLLGNVLADNGSGEDSDPDGDPLAVTTTPVSGPTNGTLVLNTDGSFSYDPDPDFNGIDSFVYAVCDPDLACDTATVTITVDPINDAPIANAQSVTTDEDTPVVITLTGSDIDGDALTFAIAAGPTNGTLGAITPIDATSAQVTYTPDPDFNGSDSFSFTVNDGTVTSPAATVSITVDVVNDPPVAEDDTFTTDEDTQLTGNVLDDNGNGTDSDPEGAPLTVTTTPVSGPSSGVLLIESDGDFTYTPNADFNGTDQFEYEVCDPEPSCDTAMVTITVDPVNDPPVAQDDAFTTDEDTELLGNVLADNGNGIDDDVDGDTLTVNTTPVSGPSNGVLVLESDGDFSYTPTADFNGTDSFEYEVCDPEPLCDTASVTISVDPVNDAPVAQDDEFTTDEDTPVNGNVLLDNGNGIDDDIEGDPLTVTTTPVSGPDNGTLDLNADGTFTYTPDQDFDGVDTFVYEACDPEPACDTATVTITVNAVDDPPIAVDDTATVDEDSGANPIDVLDNDTDVDGGPTTVDAVQNPSANGGTVLITGGGSGVSYQPAPDYCNDGSPVDTFTYTLNGGSTATVSVTVNCVNDAPAIDLDADDSEGTGGSGFAAAYTENDGPTLIVDPVDATISDIDSTTLVSLTVTITNLQDAGDEILNADASGFPDINVSYSAGVLTISSVTPQPIADYVAVLRTVTYEHTSETPTGTPDRIIEFVANDGTDDSNTATSTVIVAPVDDPPVANDDTATVEEDSGATAIDVLGNDTDVDGGPKTVDSVQDPSDNGGTVTITGGGTSLTYEPAPDYCNDPPGDDPDTFTYTLNGGSMATVSVTVTCVNDPPLAGLDSFDFIGNTELRVDQTAGGTPTVLATTTAMNGVLDNDSDPEGDSFAITAITVGACTDDTGPVFTCSDPDIGTVTMNADGTFSFEPAPGDTDATETFTYELTDDGVPAPASVNGTVTLTRFERVWYVDPNAGAGDGTSAAPFNTLDALDAADGTGDEDEPGDYIFVHDGTLAVSAPMPLEANQWFVGEGFGLPIPVALNGNSSPTELVAAGTAPLLSNPTGDLLTASAAIPAGVVGFELASGAGNVFDLTTNAALTGAAELLIADNQLNGAAAEGIDVNLGAATTGTLTLDIQNNTWGSAGTHGGTAVDINRQGGTLHINFISNTEITSNGSGVIINGGAAGSTTITGFSNNTVNGNTVGNGFVISNVTFDATPGGGVQQVAGGTTGVGASGNPVGGAGMQLTSVQGNLLFSDLDIFAGTSGLTASGPGMIFNVTPASGGTGSRILALNGPAVDVTNVTLDLQLAELQSATSTSGVSLTSVAGQFSAPSGSSIGKATGGGTAFTVATSSAVVSYGGTLNVSSGAGVSLSNNTGTVSFTGTLTVSSGTNAAFSAISGGTVTATGTGSTLTTVGAAALTVSGTNIGAAGLTFQSISANGGSRGIVLNNTGTAAGNGGLTVTGTGAANSGGIIQNMTGADDSSTNPVGTGIVLNNTKSVSLTRMWIHDHSNYGIRGNSVTGFALLNSVIDGVNGTNVSTPFRDSSVSFDGLLGTATFTSNTISGGFQHNVKIDNNGAVHGTSLLTLSMTLNTISATSAAVGDDNVHIEAGEDANMSLTVDDNNFSQAGGDHFNLSLLNNGTVSLQLNDNTLRGGHATGLGQGIFILGASYDGAFTYTISGNDIQGNRQGGAIHVNKGSGTATFSGTINNNDIGDPAIVGSGSSEAFGIIVGSRGAGGTHTTLITNNEVYQYFDRGIVAEAGEGGSALNVTITNNTVSNFADATNSLHGIHVDVGILAGDTSQVCVDIQDNQVATAGNEAQGGADIRLRKGPQAGISVRVPGLVGSTSTDVDNHLLAENPDATTVTATGSGYTGGPACTQP